MAGFGLAIMLGAMALSVFQSAPPCPAGTGELPAEFAGWAAGLDRVAPAADARGAVIPPGTPVTLRLQAGDVARLAVPPGRATRPGRYAGLVSFTAARAGRYRVAMGTRGWIDLVRDGRALASTGHGHGPACSGIAKIVDFTLTPGEYRIQIADNPEAETRVMVVAAP